jgi:hypothetical protein
MYIVLRDKFRIFGSMKESISVVICIGRTAHYTSFWNGMEFVHDQTLYHTSMLSLGDLRWRLQVCNAHIFRSRVQHLWLWNFFWSSGNITAHYNIASMRNTRSYSRYINLALRFISGSVTICESDICLHWRKHHIPRVSHNAHEWPQRVSWQP